VIVGACQALVAPDPTAADGVGGAGGVVTAAAAGAGAMHPGFDLELDVLDSPASGGVQTYARHGGGR
jgi:hypothetical protein